MQDELERVQRAHEQEKAQLEKEHTTLVEDMERTIMTKLRWSEDEVERLNGKAVESQEEMGRLKELIAKKDEKIMSVLREKQELENAKLMDE